MSTSLYSYCTPCFSFVCIVKHCCGSVFPANRLDFITIQFFIIIFRLLDCACLPHGTCFTPDCPSCSNAPYSFGLLTGTTLKCSDYVSIQHPQFNWLHVFILLEEPGAPGGMQALHRKNLNLSTRSSNPGLLVVRLHTLHHITNLI